MGVRGQAISSKDFPSIIIYRKRLFVWSLIDYPELGVQDSFTWVVEENWFGFKLGLWCEFYWGSWHKRETRGETVFLIYDSGVHMNHVVNMYYRSTYTSKYTEKAFAEIVKEGGTKKV